MRAKAVEISWHYSDSGPEPVLSLDFDPHSNRLATGGADNAIRLWSVDTGALTATFVCTLARHLKPVNVVRFSPNGLMIASGGDDGFIFIWRQNHAWQPAASAPASPEEPQEKENWTVHTSFQAATTEFYDLSWSPDSKFVAAGSPDNNVYVGTVKSGRWACVLRGHVHYVQGVAWDPRNKYLASLSSDRTCKIFSSDNHNKANFKLELSIEKRKQTRKEEEEEKGKKETQKEQDKEENECKNEDKEGNVPGRKKEKSTGENKVNGDAGSRKDTAINVEMEPSDAAALPPAPAAAASGTSAPLDPSKSGATRKLFLDENAVTSFFRRLSWSPDGTLLCVPSGVFADDTAAIYTTYVFCRSQLNRLFVVNFKLTVWRTGPSSSPSAIVFTAAPCCTFHVRDPLWLYDSTRRCSCATHKENLCRYRTVWYLQWLQPRRRRFTSTILSAITPSP
eukprot:TRINITY_DN4076_c0_g1_i1.p1 TRINITY_DN4076_c0_g1~~TRINITY_DN4076_c0_g1_i1.p1  ORF type:complete len:451 (-),score=72.64 TRINITY_DN4076_c0_g1_i1:404-1756(-)